MKRSTSDIAHPTVSAAGWPRPVDWRRLRFGMEIEAVGPDPAAIALPPGWTTVPEDGLVEENSAESGGEVRSPPLTWQERGQVRQAMAALRTAGARAGFSCGLHVHVGLEPWGEAVLLPLLDAALQTQGALQALLRTPSHRLLYCPPVTPAMRQQYLDAPSRAALRAVTVRPQSHRCGINIAAWYDIGTVEIRFANATLNAREALSVAQLALRWVAAVGAGSRLPAEREALAAALGVPATGYPPPLPAPLWFQERHWLEEALVPVLHPLLQAEEPEAELLEIRPGPDGFLVTAERPDQSRPRFLARPHGAGWSFERR